MEHQRNPGLRSHITASLHAGYEATGLARAAVTHGNSFLRNSDHAFDAAHHATDHTAHHATNHGADRTGRALTNGDALLASTDDALSLGRERHRNSGNNDGGH